MTSLQKKLAILISIALFAAPAMASADVISDLQAQINALLSQLRSLQAQLEDMKKPQSDDDMRACTMEAKLCSDGSYVGRTGPNCEFTACPTERKPEPPRCLVFYRSLSQGVNGDDVGDLQEFLAEEEFLGKENISGFFGPLTEAALRRWQSQNGLVSSGDALTTGWGVVGPMTRAWFERRCRPTPLPSCPVYNRPLCAEGEVLVGGELGSDGCQSAPRCKRPDTPTSDTLSIQGLDAPATLAIGQSGTWTVRATAPAGVQLRYSVIWGDESALAQLSSFADSDAMVRTSGTFTHAYSRPGAYAPKFTVTAGGKSESTSASVQVGGDTIACPAYIPPACPDGYESGPSSTNANGCWTPGACVPKPGKPQPPSCPVYMQQRCPDGYENGAGTTDDRGCWKPGPCVGKPGPLPPPSCPVYMLMACPAGYTNSGSTTDERGCWRPGPCVPELRPGSLSASPSSGSAPLAVTFRGSVPKEGNYRLEFGNGSSQSLPFFVNGCSDGANFGICGLSLDGLRYTYPASGTYTARLVPVCGSAADCNTTPLGTATISVGGPQVCDTYLGCTSNPPPSGGNSSCPQSDDQGRCLSSSSGSGNTNLANALTALEDALKALIAGFRQ